MRHIAPAGRARVVKHVFGLQLRTQPRQFARIEIKNVDALLGQKLLERNRSFPTVQQVVPENDLWSVDRRSSLVPRERTRHLA